VTPSVYQNLADAINAHGKAYTAEDAKELWLKMLSHQMIDATMPPAELRAKSEDEMHASGPLGTPIHPKVVPVPSEYDGGVLYPASIAYVAEFHEKFGHPIAQHPNTGNPELRALRARMILEEVLEFCEAAGLRVEVFPRHDIKAHKWLHDARVEPVPGQTLDIVEMADALGDVDYLVSGSALVFGFPHCEIMEAIHASNMSKLGEDGKPIYREDGKVMKGPNYFKPQARIEAILQKAMRKSGGDDAAYVG